MSRRDHNTIKECQKRLVARIPSRMAHPYIQIMPCPNASAAFSRVVVSCIWYLADLKNCTPQTRSSPIHHECKSDTCEVARSNKDDTLSLALNAETKYSNATQTLGESNVHKVLLVCPVDDAPVDFAARPSLTWEECQKRLLVWLMASSDRMGTELTLVEVNCALQPFGPRFCA